MKYPALRLYRLNSMAAAVAALCAATPLAWADAAADTPDASMNVVVVSATQTLTLLSSQP